MALESLLIRNFQRHAKLRIHFDPGITTIVGPTDSGKSAVLRALSWVLFNQPQGDAHIKQGEDFARVRLKVDGQEIIRQRGKENLYLLGEEEFKAFGAGVPDKVRDLLNVSEINAQWQFDAPYWFSLSSGEVSRRLNEIVDLSVIDSSLASVASTLRKARAKVEISTDRIEQLESSLKTFDYLPAFRTAVDAMTEQATAKEELHRRQAELDELYLNAWEYRKTVRDFSKMAEFFAHVTFRATHSKKVINTNALLTELIDNAERSKKAASFKIPNLGKIEQLRETCEAATAARKELAEDLDLFRTIRAAASEAKDNLKIISDNLTYTQKKLKVCPVCNQPFPNV